MVAAAAAAVLATLNVAGVQRLLPSTLVGVVMWVAVLKSGVYATLAGVAVAFLIPLRTGNATKTPPLVRAELAFAKADVRLGGLSFADLVSPFPLGIAVGLFIGSLAVSDPEHQALVRLGVPMGSVFSGVAGYATLR